jgi:signal transduction histidine kinase
MVRSSLARISTGGFSVLLSGALLLMIGGLIASDRAVRHATMAQARIDAQQSSVAVSEAIETHLHNGGTLANIASDSVVLGIVNRGPVERAAAAVVADRDTIIVNGSRSVLVQEHPESAPLSVAGQSGWKFVVAHRRDAEPLRIALWALSLTTVVFLGIALIRERRQTVRVAERSSELERLYSEVARANTAKSEFLANISHELRTPLTAVLGYISILQEGISGPLTDGQKHDLTHVKRASERLLDLIESLLELTTLKRGELDVFIEEVDPRVPLREAIALAPAPMAGVAMRLDEPTTMLPTIRSDRKKIFRILVSLLGNAAKFTERGEIVASVSLANDRVVYRVQDTGIGISADAQQYVFDEFRQVDGSPTRRFGGSGLGLSLAQRLAQLLGGTIDMASTLGEGSTFTVQLPLEYEAPVELSGET